ncbi:hypothetical protein EGR_09937 [Echinococcus granulosus]|uniref:Uncharacterized protein n=1 Tax=Echinococcus granulosus TaxID=6210 RepID=W6U3N4_ECHGR|nr:hypothetical protein EGR_09937 [Echinococcus granulosus]EUB55196.1 hypothetical protein EGR_09937 [Echinococcus granulosus]
MQFNVLISTIIQPSDLSQGFESTKQTHFTDNVFSDHWLHKQVSGRFITAAIIKLAITIVVVFLYFLPSTFAALTYNSALAVDRAFLMGCESFKPCIFIGNTFLFHIHIIHLILVPEAIFNCKLGMFCQKVRRLHLSNICMHPPSFLTENSPNQTKMFLQKSGERKDRGKREGEKHVKVVTVFSSTFLSHFIPGPQRHVHTLYFATASRSGGGEYSEECAWKLSNLSLLYLYNPFKSIYHTTWSYYRMQMDVKVIRVSFLSAALTPVLALNVALFIMKLLTAVRKRKRSEEYTYNISSRAAWHKGVSKRTDVEAHNSMENMAKGGSSSATNTAASSKALANIMY